MLRETGKRAKPQDPRGLRYKHYDAFMVLSNDTELCIELDKGNSDGTDESDRKEKVK